MLCKKINKIHGFTLLELMIVIGIIAVLLSIIIPSFQHSRDQSKFAVCMENLKNMATSVEMYAMDNKQTAPTTADGLQKLVDTGYMKGVPAEPVAGFNTYNYERADSTTAGNLLTYTIVCGPLARTAQYHGTVGIPPGYPYYTPMAGQTSGIAH